MKSRMTARSCHYHEARGEGEQVRAGDDAQCAADEDPLIPLCFRRHCEIKRTSCFICRLLNWKAPRPLGLWIGLQQDAGEAADWGDDQNWWGPEARMRDPWLVMFGSSWLVMFPMRHYHGSRFPMIAEERMRDPWLVMFVSPWLVLFPMREPHD